MAKAKKKECETCACQVIENGESKCDDGLDQYTVIKPLFSSIFYTWPKEGKCPLYRKKQD